MSQQELEESMEEAHYTFCLQDVADYMLSKGEATVMQDLLRIYQHHKLTKKSKRVTLNTDSPF